MTVPPMTAQVSSIALTEQFQRGAGLSPRPQQAHCLSAVCTALQGDAESHEPANYLVQHATGSGKSLTIASLAYELTSLVDRRANRFSLVLIISDRKVLDEQLWETVARYFANQVDKGDGTVGNVEVERAESCEHLRSVIAAPPLRGGGTRVIVTTFQKAGRGGGGDNSASGSAGGAVPYEKGRPASVGSSDNFPRGIKRPQSDASPCSSPRVAILADEAHRSHGHGTTVALHQMLCGRSGQPRHVSYISFSATPSEVALRLFGVINHRGGHIEPFHVYSLRSAIADGVCANVLSNFTTGQPVMTAIDAKGRSHSLVAASLVAAIGSGPAAGMRALQRSEAVQHALLEAKARAALAFVSTTLTEARRGGFDGKAMMVVRSRAHAAAYRQAIVQLQQENRHQRESAKGSTGEAAGAEVRVLVAFSGSLFGRPSLGEEEAEDEDNEFGILYSYGDGAAVTERSLNGVADVLTEYRRDGAALLIVCSKFETGFDEPRVCCMVIDRVLRSAHAVQVLGRANRVASGKPAPRVLDFVNSAAEIAVAFGAFYGRRVRPLAAHERRAQLEIEMAHISVRLLERIEDETAGAGATSCSAIVVRALGSASADGLCADLTEYVRACETLDMEQTALPYGYAQRLLQELRSSSAPAISERAGAASASTVQPMGSSSLESSLVRPLQRQPAAPLVAGGYQLLVGEMSTTFCGAIDLDGRVGSSQGATRALTSSASMKLSGVDGAVVTLARAVRAADSLAREAVELRLKSDAAASSFIAAASPNVPGSR